VALPAPDESEPGAEAETADQPAPAGPWGAPPEQAAPGDAKPFLPPRPRIDLSGSSGTGEAGPWGPHRK
jgi:hypothetical protein